MLRHAPSEGSKFLKTSAQNHVVTMRPVASVLKRVRHANVMLSQINAIDLVAERVVGTPRTRLSHRGCRMQTNAHAVGGFQPSSKCYRPDALSLVSHMAMPWRTGRRCQLRDQQRRDGDGGTDQSATTVVAARSMVCFDRQPIERAPAADDLEAGVVDTVAINPQNTELGGGLGNGTGRENPLPRHPWGPKAARASVANAARAADFMFI